METPACVREQRIAAVDDDIALLEMRDQLGNDVVVLHRLGSPVSGAGVSGAVRLGFVREPIGA
jgi:hypothetical protein